VVRLALPCLGLTLVGCLNFRKVDDAKAPGDMLGVYHVSGKLDDSSCGDGALGSTEHWSFDVKLSRFENDIYWLNGRETIVGDIDSDGRSFSILSEVETKISDPARGMPGCRVMRHDDAEGKLSDSGADVASFDGTLSFRYEAILGSDCADWIGTPGAVEALPCSLRYDIEGERSNDK
jgi:hypothetical protein